MILLSNIHGKALYHKFVEFWLKSSKLIWSVLHIIKVNKVRLKCNLAGTLLC